MNTQRLYAIVLTIALITTMFMPTGLAVDEGMPGGLESSPPGPSVEPTTSPTDMPADEPPTEPTPEPTAKPTAAPAIKFKVDFIDWDGALIASESVEKGADAVAPVHPVRKGYVADGWDIDFTNVQKDLTVTALYKPVSEGQELIADAAMILAAEMQHTVHLYVYVGNAPHNPPLLVHYALTDISDAGLATLQGNQNWSTFFTNLNNATSVNLSSYIGLSASQYYGNGKISLDSLGNNVYEVKVYLKNGAISTTYTVHYVDEDGNTIYPSVTKNGDVGDTVTESAPAALGYITPSNKTITLGFGGNVITFVYIANTYTVTWNNFDGTLLEQDLNVPFGASPSYDGATPMRAATAEFTYTFSGWTPAVSPVTGNVTYTATFTAATNTYTVTWNNFDGTLLEQDLNVPFGASPSYDGATPMRAATAEFTYTFSGWTPAVSPVTGNVTYTATFTAATNTYTVTWNNFDGTLLEQDLNVPFGASPSYDGATPMRAATAQFTYTFSGWTPAVSPVTGNVTYTATFTAATNTYTVTWNNFDGTLLELDLNVPYGASPNFNGATPARAATAQFTYTFGGWTPAVSPVTGNVTYTATFTAATNTYTVTWNNFDGTLLELDLNVPYGAAPNYGGATPTRAATAEFTYTFSAWTPAVSPVTGNVTYTATYTAVTNTYTVTFVDFDGTVLKTQIVPYGGAAQAPDSPDRDGYTFTGWDISFDTVTSDLTVTALYELIPAQVDDEEIPATIDEEPVPQGGFQQNLNWLWWLLLIPLLLLLLLLLLWYNVSISVFGPDEKGQEKLLRTIRRLKRRKENVIISLKDSHIRGGEYGIVELTKPFTRRMRGNRLTVDVEGANVLSVVVPDDAKDRFQERINSWIAQ